MTDETDNAILNKRIALADARTALDYATRINDRYGMANAMRRIRLAKVALSVSERGATRPAPPETA